MSTGWEMGAASVDPIVFLGGTGERGAPLLSSAQWTGSGSLARTNDDHWSGSNKLGAPGLGIAWLDCRMGIEPNSGGREEGACRSPVIDDSVCCMIVPA